MNKLFTIAVLLLTLTFVTFEASRLFLSLWPPLKIVSAKIVNTEVKAGGELFVDYVVIRNRICKQTVNRFIQRKADNVLVLRLEFPGNAVQLGRIEQRGVVRLPENMELGEYTMTTANFFECYEGMHAVVHDALAFKVVK